MKTWAPLWSGIVTSSIWDEPDYVLKIFLTMMALKDSDHVVRLSAYQIGKFAKKGEAEVLEALKILSSPDTKRIEPQEYEGRRIQAVEEGWLILNGQKYRDMVRLEMVRSKNRKAQAAYRARQKAVVDPKPPEASERPIEPPKGFPASADDAVRLAGACGADPVFISTLWNSAMAQGGIAGNGRAITSWQHYVAKHWPGEQAKRAQARASGKPDPTKTIEDVVRADKAREIKMTLKSIERLEDESRL